MRRPALALLAATVLSPASGNAQAPQLTFREIASFDTWVGTPWLCRLPA